MPDLKLAKLPDRTPVKLMIAVMSDLYRELGEYVAIYNETYGQEASLVELAPHMLATFLASDRGFAKARTAQAKSGGSNV